MHRRWSIGWPNELEAVRRIVGHDVKLHRGIGDRRGEVILWSNPAQPPGNSLKAVVPFGVLPRGESMITDATRQCFVPDPIVYYYIQFDDTRAGWIDVDYLQWKRPRES